MQYSFTINEPLAEELTAAIFSKPGLEGAAYVLCGVSEAGETRLLARSVIPVKDEHYLRRESYRLSIASDSYVPIAKRARQEREAILFVHSHPENVPDFSPQDNQEERKLHEFFHSRAPGLPHGSLVFNTLSTFRGRIYSPHAWLPIERGRFIGRRFRFVDIVEDREPLPDFFDRQVRAFGPDIQLLLRHLHIGVVGAGGTGSATIEQLIRLGVGTISVFDRDVFDSTNATRVYGSSLNDQGRRKTEIQVEHANRIGLKTTIRPFPEHITEEGTAKELRSCDILFGCTDKHAPRAILCSIATRYLIPVIDMAVRIDSKDGIVRGITGRVTTLLPGEACLFCRERINPDTIRAEGLPPEQRERELEEGYIKQLATNEPAVVSFTTAVAAQAINEMIHRLTGFMGAERQSSEVLMLFSECGVRTNRDRPKPDCICQVQKHWGRGDTPRFLGKVW
jgi:molybdopterin/thiamine biosynthesis adenylyltransferase